MRHGIASAFLFLLAVLPLSGQSSHGYAFIAPGSATGGLATAHAGGGFEALVFKRWVGVGAEAGYLTFTEDWGGGVGVASPNVYFHIPVERFSSVDPYVTAGYSLLFRSGTQSAFNYGGGLNWWFRPSTGIKIEIRDHTHDKVHYWGVRFGITFR